MLDAIAGVTGVGDKFDGYPMGTRACELPDTGVASYFLDLFGRPARSITCECERSDMPTLGQMLHLMNDVGLNARLSSKTGRVTTLLEAKTPDAKLVEELYLSALSRFPTTEEKTRAVKALSTALPANRQKDGGRFVMGLAQFQRVCVQSLRVLPSSGLRPPSPCKGEG